MSGKSNFIYIYIEREREREREERQEIEDGPVFRSLYSP
jgi:hypothetical protein